MTNICRLCLFEMLTPAHPESEDDALNKTKIKIVLPEMDLDMTTTLTLCNLCLPLLSAAYQFKRRCLTTERNLKLYIGKHNLSLPIELKSYIDSREEDVAEVKSEIMEDEDGTDMDFLNYVELKFDGDITCDRCNEVFHSNESYNIHKKLCALYKCNECEEGFSTEEMLQAHSGKHLLTKLCKCQHCNTTFKTELDLSIHLLDEHSSLAHKKTQVHKCEHCGTSFATELDLSNHLLNQHSLLSVECNERSESQMHKSQHCNTTFAKELDLSMHLLKQHSTTASVNKEGSMIHAHECQHCDTSLTTQLDLSIHLMNQHSSLAPLCERGSLTKPQSHKCQHCDTSFTTEMDLSIHLLNLPHSTALESVNSDVCNKPESRKKSIKKPESKRKSIKKSSDICDGQDLSKNSIKKSSRSSHKSHACLVCCKVFRRKGGLDAHMEFHNREDIKCDLCEKTLPGKIALKEHLQRHENACTCETCGRTCFSSRELVRHMRTHSNERPFRCEICGMGFRRNFNLVTHKRGVHSTERSFVCYQCGKAFSIRSTLTSHLKSHEYKDAEKTFCCEFENCEKKFHNKKLLNRHMLRHGEKNVLCDLCGMGFTSKSHLRQHMITHTGERPYECKICNKTFTTQRNLQVHHKKKHHDM